MEHRLLFKFAGDTPPEPEAAESPEERMSLSKNLLQFLHDATPEQRRQFDAFCAHHIDAEKASLLAENEKLPEEERAAARVTLTSALEELSMLDTGLLEGLLKVYTTSKEEGDSKEEREAQGAGFRQTAGFIRQALTIQEERERADQNEADPDA